MGEKQKDVESDIAQLQALRERAVDGGQSEWVHRIDVQLATLKAGLKEVTEPEQQD